MSLSNNLLSQFAKLTNNKPKTTTESTVYGTIKAYGDSLYVQLDGSELLTPVDTTVTYEVGERVAVKIQNHTATVTGNLSSPSARNSDVVDVKSKVITVEEVLAGKVDTETLVAEVARITKLETDNVKINETLVANNGKFETLTAENVKINETLVAHSGKFEALEADNLKINESLEAANAIIYNLDSTYAKIEKLTAAEGRIGNLETGKLSVKDAEVTYANIDFSNIKMAAVEELFTKSGIIKDLVVGEQKITGELVGVTIKGDLIEAGTVVADKLVVKGSDGILYKLNVDAAGISKEEAPTDSLHGSLITAKSIVAEKIAVTDLVAFGATIGGFKINDDSIHSVAKTSVNNTTRGIYFDNDGQMAFGDANNYVKFYEDSDGVYRLAISADSLTFGTSKKSIEDEIETLKDEITTSLYIESSRGMVFKNDTLPTVLSVVVVRGSQRITDMNTLKQVMGQNYYLQWKWLKHNEESYGIISADDERIGNDGFTFTLSPEDVDVKVTFICELID